MQYPNSCPLTPLDFLERAAVVYGDCPSILYHEESHTWSETRTRCLKLASTIVSLGITKGDVVSVLAPNVPAMCELHFAVPMAGAILNTVNLRLDTKAIFNLLQHCDSKLVFVDCQWAALAREAVSMFPRTSQSPVLVLIRDEYYENDSLDRKDYDREYYLDYESMVESGDPGFEWIRPESEWEPISLNYTSDSLLDWSVPKQPVYLWTLPMFHANGWSYAWNLAAVGGVHVCLRRVDAASIYEAIERYGVTHMCGAPVVLNMLTNHTGCKPLENPVHVMTAGAPPPAAVLGRAESLGFVVSHGYGLTETGGLVVTCAWKREWDNLPGAERAKMKSRQGVKSIAFSGFDVLDPDSGTSVPRDGLPRYMVPRTVVFKDELPKTSTGKLQKFLLRDMAKELGNF
ncbi:probable acyl-activating enzyme 6 [Phtheirospermum japonicum]|uniref:Probable acyl-activating enzyme 6 n=1 Tax=Phtheirospermum japonicum TaxID=374723 RepID=A0A830CLD5_9LAMI|nr:probable acyl-activating enzyme 6 [Phtheirospermum japonicum]